MVLQVFVSTTQLGGGELADEHNDLHKRISISGDTLNLLGNVLKQDIIKKTRTETGLNGIRLMTSCKNLGMTSEDIVNHTEEVIRDYNTRVPNKFKIKLPAPKIT